jgi:hypothetical protein
MLCGIGNAWHSSEFLEVIPSMRILRRQAANACLFLMFLGAFFGLTPAANASAGNNGVKIVAWYGAGSLSKSEYGRDTIILFNPTDQDVDMTGWTIQTGGTTGAFSTIYTFYSLPLPGARITTGPIIKANSYFAIAGSGVAISTTACNSAHCNTADASYDAQLAKLSGTTATQPTTTDNNLSSTAVVAALVSGSTSVGSSCALAQASPNLVDLLGISAIDGSNSILAGAVTCFAGGGPAPYTSNDLNTGTNTPTTTVHGTTYAYATVRKNRCVDTFNNYADFALGYIDFENSKSPAKPCPTGSQMQVLTQAIPSSPVLSAPFLLTTQVTPPTGLTIASVVADTSALNTATTYTAPTSVTMYDDGTHGDLKAGDGIYSVTLTAPAAYLNGIAGVVPGLNVTVTDSAGNQVISDAALALGTSVPGPGNNNLEMIAWYGAGSLAGSQYARDTIILFNPTTATISLGNYSLQAGGATGSFTAVTYKLPNVPIPPGGFYAIAASGTQLSKTACVSTYGPSPCNDGYAYDYELSTIEDAAATPPTVPNEVTLNILSSTNTSYALVNENISGIDAAITPVTKPATPQKPSDGPGGLCDLYSNKISDIIGVGAFDGSAPVTCYPGTNSAPYTPATYNGQTTSINGVKYAFATVRTNRCGNTFDNGKDWELGYIDFENSQSTPQPCSAAPSIPLQITASASPAALGLTDPLTITAAVRPATNSSGVTNSAVTVLADLTNLGLSSATVLHDDGKNGDAIAGDGIYTVVTAALSTNNIGVGAVIPQLDVTATDGAGDRTSTTVPVTITPGFITLTSATYTATEKAGGVAVFPLTIVGTHGYQGIITISCTGSPNTNNLGVPVATQCITSPPQITMATNATATCQLGIALGTTFSAGLLSRSFSLMLLSLLSIAVLSIGIWRRKQLPIAMLLAFITLLAFNTTGCGKDGGLQNTNAASGTYTYVVTATDSTVPTITSTINLKVIVQ